MIKFLLTLAALLAPAAAYADPISAIAAIAAMAEGAGGLAAIGGVLAGGLTGVAGLGLAGGLMFAGGALGLVGAVTGNKKLTKLGAAMGLAGGVRQMFTSLTSAAAPTAELAKSAGAEALAQTAPLEQVASQTASGGAQEAAQLAAEQAGQGAAPLAAKSGEMVGNAAPLGETVAPPVDARAGVRGAAGYGPEGMTGVETKAADLAANGSAFDKLVGWTEAHPKAADIGGGILKGAATMYANAQPDGRTKQILDYEEQRRKALNASITGMAKPGQFINSNVDPTAGRTPRNVIRYVPNRGIIRSVTPNGA
jgi:hypothetical protein